jgi:hypothetical protein
LWTHAFLKLISKEELLIEMRDFYMKGKSSRLDPAPTFAIDLAARGERSGQVDRK